MISSKTEKKILLIDDESLILKEMELYFTKNKYMIDTEVDVERALQTLEKFNKQYFLVITDYNMPKYNGLHVLKKIKNRYPMIETIILTGAGSEDIAIQSLRLGAFDYVRKPFDVKELLLIVEQALELYKLKEKNIEYYNKIKSIKKESSFEVENLRYYIREMEQDILKKNKFIHIVQEFFDTINKEKIPSAMYDKIKQMSKLLDKTLETENIKEF